MHAIWISTILALCTLCVVSCGPKKDTKETQKLHAKDSTEVLLGQYPDSVELLNQSAFNALQKGDTSRSVQLLSQSLGLQLDQPAIENELGFLLAAIKSEQSLLIATRMTKNEKGFIAAQGHYIKGLYYSNTGNDGEAIQSFDSSIISNFTFTDAYIEKAILLYTAKDYNRAIDALTKAIELDRKNADIYFWMGSCLEEKNQVEQAIAYYQEAIRLDPQHAGANASYNNIKKQ